MMKLDFKQNITLENDKVILRPLVPEDFDALLHFSINEPELWEFSLQPGNGPENLKNYLDFAFNEKAQERSYPFLVIDKSTGKVAGSTRFYDYQKGHNTIQLGYTWYGKEFQRTGLNRNCKYLLLNYAFHELKLDRVEFRADNKNLRSITSMKKIGCVEEGVLRSNCASPTDRRGSIILSILRHEWIDEKKNKLQSLIFINQ